MKRVVMGIVDSPVFAEATLQRLVDFGFSPKDVSVLYPDRHGDHDFGFEAHTKAPEGALMGIGFGAILGAMFGLTAGLAGLVPALALLVVSGPLLLALSGAAVGALVLGLVGVLFGLSMPEIEAKLYEGKSRRGTILIAVHANRRSDVRRAREVFRSVAATDIHALGEAALPASSRA
jgi:hypothetical protein